MKNPASLSLFAFLLLSACHKKDGQITDYPISDQFKTMEEIGKSNDSELQEVSGLVVSHQNPGYFWAHNDSGDKARLFLIDQSGEIRLTVFLTQAANVDWEDIAIKRTSEGATIFIGDIGDNRAERSNLQIYAMDEPILDSIDTQTKEISWAALSMTVSYENGARDAETLLYDPIADELLIISKRDKEVIMYPFDFLSDQELTLKPSGTLPLTQITAGDVSDEGNVLLKNYEEVYFIENKGKSRIAELLRSPTFLKVNYKPERQGEAIAWNLDSDGFFVLSEWNDNQPQPLFYYHN